MALGGLYTHITGTLTLHFYFGQNPFYLQRSLCQWRLSTQATLSNVAKIFDGATITSGCSSPHGPPL